MTLPELITALEQVPGPSRELDAEIAALTFKAPHSWPSLPEGACWEFIPEWDGLVRAFAVGAKSTRPWRCWASPEYTRSLDAAMTLGLADGWVNMDHRRNSETGERECHFHWDLSPALYTAGATAATFPLACCIAALKARMA